MLKFFKKNSNCCSIKIEEVKEDCCSTGEVKNCCSDEKKNEQNK